MGLAVISHSSPQEPGVSEKQLPTPSWNIVGTENVLILPLTTPVLCVCEYVCEYGCMCVSVCMGVLCNCVCVSHLCPSELDSEAVSSLMHLYLFS